MFSSCNSCSLEIRNFPHVSSLKKQELIRVRHIIVLLSMAGLFLSAAFYVIEVICYLKDNRLLLGKDLLYRFKPVSSVCLPSTGVIPCLF